VVAKNGALTENGRAEKTGQGFTDAHWFSVFVDVAQPVSVTASELVLEGKRRKGYNEKLLNFC